MTPLVPVDFGYRVRQTAVDKIDASGASGCHLYPPAWRMDRIETGAGNGGAMWGWPLLDFVLNNEY